jgi:hypothetical protein
VHRNCALLYRPREGDALAGVFVERYPVHLQRGESILKTQGERTLARITRVGFGGGVGNA